MVNKEGKESTADIEEAVPEKRAEWKPEVVACS